MHGNISTLFHKPADSHYFLTHSIGLQPKQTSSELQNQYLHPWQTGSEDIWPQWLETIDAFKAALAKLLNTSAHLLCPQTNVSSGLSKIVSSLPKKPGKSVIVASETDFPSTGFVLKQAEKMGYTLRIISKDQDLQSPEVWSEHLRGNTIMALITQAQYSSNRLNPISEIGSLCREKDIISVVDAAQSIGISNIDLTSLKIDVLLGSSIKWLCGGPGAGFLWVNQSTLERLEPSDVGWFSHLNPFEFDINSFIYADDASRFWGGTPSIAPYICATTSVNLLLKLGLDHIIDHNRQLCQTIMDNVPARFIASPLDLSKKGGTVVLSLPDSNAFQERLSNRKILHDCREYGVRVSPHIYTTSADIERLLNCV